MRCLRVNSRGDRRFLVEDLQSFMLDGLGRAARAASRRDRLGSPDRVHRQAGHATQPSQHGRGDRNRHLPRAAAAHRLPQRARLPRPRRTRSCRWPGAARSGTYTGEDGEQLRLRVGEGITGWVAEHGVAQYLPDAAARPARLAHAGHRGGPARVDAGGADALRGRHHRRHRPLQARARPLRARTTCATSASTPRSPPRPWSTPTSPSDCEPSEETLDRQLRSQRELLRVTERILTNLDPAALRRRDRRQPRGAHPGGHAGHLPASSRRARTRAPCWPAASGPRRSWPGGCPTAAGWSPRCWPRGEARSVGRAGRRIGPPCLILAPLRGRERVLGILHLKRVGEQRPLRAARVRPRAAVRGTRLDRPAERPDPPSCRAASPDRCLDRAAQPRHVPRRPRRRCRARARLRADDGRPR